MGSIEPLSIMMEAVFACTSAALLLLGSTRTSRQKQVTRHPDERCGVVRLRYSYHFRCWRLILPSTERGSRD